MVIVFDLDNTIIDEYGQKLRPGILELIKKLKHHHDILILWTNSKKERAEMILEELEIKMYFNKFIYREEYDPNELDGLKDIRKVQGDILIDDNPKQKLEAANLGFHVILVKPFTSTRNVQVDEMEQVYQEIKMIRQWGNFYPFIKYIKKLGF